MYSSLHPNLHALYTCTNCGDVELDRTDMNCRLACHKCNSLSFGLIKETSLSLEEYKQYINSIKE